MKAFILLPAYNEEKTFELLLKDLDTTLKFLEIEAYEIVIVDDGSTDNSLDILYSLKDQYPLQILHHSINRGLGETIRDGLEYICEFAHDDDIIIRLDTDNTHKPEYIPSMVRKIREGNDVVVASRFKKGGGQKGLDLYRASISRCANLFLKILFPIKGLQEYSCGFRAYRAGIIKEAIRIFGNQFISLKGLGFTCTIEKLVKLRLLDAKIDAVPFVLRYDAKIGCSKMITSMTTIGYLVLALKHLYPWGGFTRKMVAERKEALKNQKENITKTNVRYICNPSIEFFTHTDQYQKLS